MINLIPPTAKKAVKKEYLIRVFTVWMFLATFGCLIIAALQIPTYVLVEKQKKALALETNNAQLMQESFKDAEQVIADTNALSAHLEKTTKNVPFSTLITELDSVTGTGVTLTQIILEQDMQTHKDIRLVGNAATRSALADFSSRVEQHVRFDAVELPISNLAKDRDINFTMTVRMAESE